MQTIKACNDYVLVEKIKTTEVDTHMFFKDHSISDNKGVVINCTSYPLIVGKIVYFNNQYSPIKIAGKDLLAMKFENIIAEETNE